VPCQVDGRPWKEGQSLPAGVRRQGKGALYGERYGLSFSIGCQSYAYVALHGSPRTSRIFRGRPNSPCRFEGSPGRHIEGAPGFIQFWQSQKNGDYLRYLALLYRAIVLANNLVLWSSKKGKTLPSGFLGSRNAPASHQANGNDLSPYSFWVNKVELISMGNLYLEAYNNVCRSRFQAGGLCRKRTPTLPFGDYTLTSAN